MSRSPQLSYSSPHHCLYHQSQHYIFPLTMADPVSSNPAHSIFVFLIPTIAMVVQMHFPDTSPVDKHPANLWIFIVCLILYASSYAYFKSHGSTSNNENPYFKSSSHIASISGSMACAALISVLVSKPVLAFIIIIYFTGLVIYLLICFAPNPVTEKCKKIGSDVYDMCKRIKHKCDPRSQV